MRMWQRWVRQPQTVLLRRALFQVHLWVGIALGLYVLVICLSGSILVYRNEIYRAFRFERGEPIPAGYRAAAWLLDLHDNLLAGETGRHVNGIGALLLLLVAITGAVVWWPGIKTWRRSLIVEVRRSSTRLIWSLHSALGFWFLGFLVMWCITGLYLTFPDVFSETFDYIQPMDEAHPVERLVDRITYWLAYLHFGRLGGRGIPGCGRGVCDSVTKAIWAVAGIVPPAMFVTGALMWWRRVLRPARRRVGVERTTGIEPQW